MTLLVQVPAEQVRIGDRIHISRKLGVRRVTEILEYDMLGLEQIDSFMILYQAPGPGVAWENRAGAKGKTSLYPREAVALRPYRRGEQVQLERLHLVKTGS